MASTEINGRVRHKRDTDLNWSIHNPILLDGEIIIVDMSDGSVRTKTGDGTSHYSQLNFNDGDLRTSVTSLSGRVDTLDDEMDNRYTKSEVDSALAEKQPIGNYASQEHTHDAGEIITGMLSANRLPLTPILKGGTGATTAEGARENLGAAPAYTYGTTDLTAGVSPLATGVLYLVYE